MNSDDLPPTLLPEQVLDCPMSAYIILGKQEAKQRGIHLLASTGFLECVGVLGRLYSAAGEFEAAGIAHLTVHNDEVTTLSALCSELQSYDPKGVLKFTLNGSQNITGKEDVAYPFPAHTKNSLRQGVQSALSEHDVEDFTLQDDLTNLLATDMRTGNVFLGDGNRPNHICSAAEIAMYYFTTGKTRDYLKAIEDHDIEAKRLGKRIPATRLDWSSIITDIRLAHKAHRNAINLRIFRELGSMPPFGNSEKNFQKVKPVTPKDF